MIGWVLCLILPLKAEDRAHRRGQTKAVNIYIFCAKVFIFLFYTYVYYLLLEKFPQFFCLKLSYGEIFFQDTPDESLWQKLNKSLRHVSSTVNGKYDAIQEIEVLYLKNSLFNFLFSNCRKVFCWFSSEWSYLA